MRKPFVPLALAICSLLSACQLFESSREAEAEKKSIQDPTPETILVAKDASSEEAFGSVELSIDLGKTGSLAKASDIQLTRLFVTLTAPEVRPIYDTLKISGNGKILATKTYNGLTANRKWTLSVYSQDQSWREIHRGSSTFDVMPGKTTLVTLDLAAKYSMLKAAFSPIRKGVSRCAIFVDGSRVKDSSFQADKLGSDSVQLAYDYLSTPAWHKIKLIAYGIVEGHEVILYSGDSTFKVEPGVDASYKITLHWSGPGQPLFGAATMEGTLGRVGTIKLKGELKDESRPSGLVLHLPLDGHAKDMGPFGNHGSVKGPVAAEDRFGNLTGALSFDGVNDSVLVPDAPSLNAFTGLTLSLWVKLPDNYSNSGSYPMLDKYPGGKEGYRVSTGYDGLTGMVKTSESSRWVNDRTSRVSPSPMKGIWSHVVLTWDGSRIDLYRDGALKESEYNFVGMISGNGHPLLLGASVGTSQYVQYFKGTLDDIQIFNRGFSEEEITKLFKGEFK